MKAMDNDISGHMELGNVFAIGSVTLFILHNIGMGEIAAFFGALSGAASVFINWPKIKKRITEVMGKRKNE